MSFLFRSLIIISLYHPGIYTIAQDQNTEFNVLAFYTARHDAAHISFLKQANDWFSEQSVNHKFRYSSTSNWNRLNEVTLDSFQVILFLDTRPEQIHQRAAFESYIKKGGAWMGFHFAAFSLTPSDYPQNWDWYHEKFLGSGQYKSNTWRPTTALLKVEDHKHPILAGMPDVLLSAPNEWYRWENDLTKNPDIKILLSIHPDSFPLGTGPKPHEIWHNGYYPVAWTNKNYRMVYMNMGHDDIDYEAGSQRSLSSTFSSEMQNRFILQSLLWLGNKQDARYQLKK